MKDEQRPIVLLVEDESTLAMIIQDTLEEEGFDVICAADGLQGLNSFQKQKPNIVIADVMMPKMDGFEMVSRIRKLDSVTPILFLTARSSLDDLVNGFELGANDYLRKPFKMLELVMRVKALTNRIPTDKNENEVLQFGGYSLNVTTQQLTFGNESEELSHFESEILKRLCLHKNDVVEIRDILIALWNDDSYYNRNSLHVFIHKLRVKLSKDKNVKILNIRGIGYKLLA